jgi:8-oxo-dGTP diphosphatase
VIDRGAHMRHSRAAEQRDRPIRVGVGLIRRGDCFLVRPRPPETVYAGYWEFPGGKCELGETPAQAARRECLEETGLVVVVGSLRRVIDHVYPHGHVRLYFYDCEPEDPGAEPSAGSGCRWTPANELHEYRFPEANEPILDELVSG